MQQRLLRSTYYLLRSNRGFTLIEMVIYIGITAIVMGIFSSILITVTDLQGRESSNLQIVSESNFILNTIKRNIHDGLYVTVPATTSEEITIATDASSTNPVRINRVGGFVYIQEATNPPEEISTSRIVVNQLLFTNVQNASSQAIQIYMQVTSNTGDVRRRITQEIRTSAAPLLKNN